MEMENGERRSGVGGESEGNGKSYSGLNCVCRMRATRICLTLITLPAKDNLKCQHVPIRPSPFLSESDSECEHARDNYSREYAH